MLRFYSFLLAAWLLALLPRLAAATNPTLTLQGQGSGASDITAFVDQVQILDASGNVVANAVGDPSFETVPTSTYVYQPTGSAWMFVGAGGSGAGAGVTANGSAFGPPTAPTPGTQAAFVQRTGLLRQMLTLAPGTYRVQFMMAQRGGNAVAQQLDVQILGVSVGVASLGGSTAYAQFTSSPFTVTSGGAPTITGFSPARAAEGETVTLTGTNLSGTSSVVVNGVAATGVTVLTTAQLTFVVPRGTGSTQQVTVTTPDGTASSTGLTITGNRLVSTTPAFNARRAPRLGSPVSLTFNDAIAAGTVQNLAVYSAQVGGRKAGQWTGGGTATLRYRSTLAGSRGNFQPGEVVSVSVPSTVQNTSGSAVQRQVFQFTAAVGGTGTGSFSGGSDLAVGRYPYGIAVGDVDGDGDLDLLTANNNSVGTVSVRLNDGTGTFSSGANVAVDSNPYSVVLGDVDGDGDLDLLTPSTYGGVSVRFNDGTGTFTGTATINVGSSRSLALGDVDGDGDLDLLVGFLASGNANLVRVRLNNGAGSFSGGSDAAVGVRPYSVALGDVDGDGDLDLLTANQAVGTVSVRFNDGAGTFSGGSDPTVGGGPNSVAVGDVDGDGDLDFITANTVDGTVSVRLNDGTGSFSGGADIAAGGSYNVALGDVDGDGDLDLLATRNTGIVSVRLNDGMGTFSGGSDPVVSGSYSVAVGDVDGDGDLDLLTTNSSSSGTVSVRLNGGTALAVTAMTPLPNAVAAPATSAVTATFNQPLAAGAAAGLRVYSAQRGGLRTSSTPATVSGSTLSYAPPAARPFLPGETVYSTLTTSIAASSGATLPSARVQQFTVAVGGSGRGNFGGGSTAGVGTKPSSVAVGDVDGDGDLDLLTANYNDNNASVRLNNGAGSFSGGSNLSVGSGPRGVALGDVDGDGDLDLLTANQSSNNVSVRLNNGAGSFSGGSDPAAGSGPLSVALGDVDGDGDLDFVAANNGSSTVSVRLNNGAGSFSGGSNPAVGSSPASVVLGDVDGDGDLDLLTANNVGTVSVRFNNGAGNFSGGSDPAVGTSGGNNYPYSVAVGDVDGDGDLDFVVANHDLNYSGFSTISVRLNNGAGNFSSGTNSELVLGSYPTLNVALGDIDSDGDLDLLATLDSSGGTVSVRLNDGTGNFTAPATNPAPAVGNGPQNVVLGDVDGDGDLDFVTANILSNTVSVRLNDGTALTVTASSLVAAGVGIPITLTGTNLNAAGTSVTVGGVAAATTASSATSLTFPVPAGVAAGSVPLVVSNGGGTVSLPFTFLAAPGNALAFDGSDDYVSLPAGVVTALQNDFTLELWLRTTQSGTGAFGVNRQWWEGTGLLDGEVTGAATDYGLSLRGNRVAFGVGGNTGAGSTAQDVTIQSTTAVADGRWHYVVATRQASTGAMTLYVDGQPQATGTGSTSARTAPPQLTLGVLQSGTSGSNFFTGSLDEVRLWSLVRSAQDVAAAYQAGPPTNFNPSGLVAYYSFDEGLPGGTNTDVSQLFDLTTNALPGTLTGFARTSDVSNFVASYALVVPTATAATGQGSGSFTANWTAPVVGTLTSYLLDVSTAADFTAPVAGSPFTVASGTTSQAVTGLTGSRYYYRVRAELSSLTGQGASSNVVAVSTTPLPVQLVSFTAIAQGNAAVRLAWTTASEVNSAYFAIERSLDGRTFAPLGQVAAAGSSTTSHAYFYSDAPVPTGLLYYRLRQVDLDGSFTYSPVRMVTTQGLGLTLYPNPASHATTLSGAEAEALVQVYDARGSLVLTTQANAAGTAALVLPQSLPSGLYLVRSGAGPALRLTVE